MGSTGRALSWFGSWVYIQVSRQGPSLAPYQLSTGASQGPVLGPLLFSIYMTLLRPFSHSHAFILFLLCRWHPAAFSPRRNQPQTKCHMSLGRVHVDTGTFNCSWSSQGTKPFITTSSSRLTPHLWLLSQLLKVLESWLRMSWLFLSSRAASPDSASEKSAHSWPNMGVTAQLTLLTQVEFNFNKHLSILQAWLKADRRSVQLLKQWSTVYLSQYLHFTIHLCVLTERGAAQEGAEADPLGPGDDCSHRTAFTSIESAEGENPAYVSWAKRNAHALRAKSETWQKRGNGCSLLRYCISYSCLIFFHF